MTRRPKALVGAAMLVAVLASTQANARQKNITFKNDPHARHMPVYKPAYAPCCSPGPGVYRKKKKRFHYHNYRKPVAVRRVKPKETPNILQAYSRAVSKGSASLIGVVAPLAAKANEIMSACGSRVTSGVRHTRIRGSGRMSLHSTGEAVDMQGNPACIYRFLAGWRGGYSTDYRAVNHVHISHGKREWGMRFAHYSGRNRVRYARRWKHRYASAN